MVNKAEILEGKELRRGCWIDVKIWEWEYPSLLPIFYLGFNFRSP